MLITDPRELARFETKHRIWQGIPGIARTKEGRTFISFYSGGVKEEYGNYALLICSDTDTDFGEPVAAAFLAGNYRCFDPVVWIDPLQRLWFIWNVMPGERVMAAICEHPDAAQLRWGKPFEIGRGVMMNQPTVLSDHTWLFPIALWREELFSELRAPGASPNETAGSYVYQTKDVGRTFYRLGCADVPDRSFDEHMLFEQEDGGLRMLIRLKDGIGESFSYDGGVTWSEGRRSVLTGPGSRFHITRLPSGRVLLLNHYRFSGRNNLTALLSEDDGKTFPYTLLLDERNAVAYPDAAVTEDGTIYVVYDRERGAFKTSLSQVYAEAREILTAKITEDDIMEGRLVSKGSFLKNVVSRLTMLSEEDGDPFADMQA